MKKRFLISGGVLAACVGIGLTVVNQLPPRPSITKANFDRIRMGMTFAEVKAIFGTRDSSSEPSLLGGDQRVWVNDDKSGAIIMFDETGRVSDLTWADSTETIGQKLLRLFHWPWW